MLSLCFEVVCKILIVLKLLEEAKADVGYANERSGQSFGMD